MKFLEFFTTPIPKIPVFLFLLLGTFSLLGCGMRERTQRVYDEWGRASLQGQASRGGEIGLAVQSDGSAVTLGWFGRNSQNDEVLQVKTINNLNETIAEFDIELGGTSPSNLQLVANGDEVLAAWIVQSGSWRALRIVRFDWVGESDGEALLISAENSDVRWFNIETTSSDDAYLFWLDDTNTLHGEQFIANSFTGILEQEDVRAADFVATQSSLHIAWTNIENTLFYAQHSPDQQTIRGTRTLTNVDSDSLTLSLDSSHAYIGWQQSPDPVTFTAFDTPTAIPFDLTNSVAMSLTVPNQYPPQRYFGQEMTSELALPVGNVVSASRPSDVTMLATMMRVATNYREQAQPVVFYLQDGEMVGYQVLTWTGNDSGKLAISADADNNLYLAWLDIQRGDKPVYLMTTQPDLREATSRLTWRDYGLIVGGGIGRIAQAFRLIPLVLPWILTPVFYFFFVVAFVGGNTSHWRARNAFLFGVLIYTAVKYWFGLRGDPALLQFIPNAGLLVPATKQLLIYTVPIIILTISVMLIWGIYIRRARQVSHSTWFFFIVLLDFILSLSVYALEFFA